LGSQICRNQFFEYQAQYQQLQQMIHCVKEKITQSQQRIKTSDSRQKVNASEESLRRLSKVSTYISILSR
jgi:hypothetical protein